ncbi:MULTISPECIES: ANTAR domain-containing protein [Streptomyces]|uniref:ANTAR domain-containing protein n=1 Tax=Streptomyces aureus TaxID=193461 RepID=A0ABV4STH8_9ACTN|nr:MULTISPECIES: ANTAR domain-containing protein [unclassified Streptomyces]WSD93057.1 ANTAR domain-containing protein [Streptomyces sp. NBC_01474]
MAEGLEVLVSDREGGAGRPQPGAFDAVVDQAAGVLIAVGRMTSAEAWDVLRETSMRTDIKLRHVAELLVEWGRTGALCADIRTELDRQLAQRRPAPGL